MREIITDVAIVGAGSAGLSAAYQAASAGADVLVIDENARPGGQLFKQIHKFFGSKEHQAGTRGFVIGEQLLDKVEKSGAKVLLDSLVYGHSRIRKPKYVYTPVTSEGPWYTPWWDTFF